MKNIHKLIRANVMNVNFHAEITFVLYDLDFVKVKGFLKNIFLLNNFKVIQSVVVWLGMLNLVCGFNSQSNCIGSSEHLQPVH